MQLKFETMLFLRSSHCDYSGSHGFPPGFHMGTGADEKKGSNLALSASYRHIIAQIEVYVDLDSSQYRLSRTFLKSQRTSKISWTWNWPLAVRAIIVDATDREKHVHIFDFLLKAMSDRQLIFA